MHDAEGVAAAAQDHRLQHREVDRLAIGLAAGDAVGAEHPALAAFAADLARLELPARGDRHVHVERQVAQGIGFYRRVGGAELEHHQTAVEKRESARSVLVAQRGVERVDGFRRRARLPERAARPKQHERRQPPHSCLARLMATFSSTNTSFTAMPFSGPSIGRTVISMPLLPWTSNACEKRLPASIVSRQPFSSSAAKSAAAGRRRARNEYTRPSASGSPSAVTCPA